MAQSTRRRGVAFGLSLLAAAAMTACGGDGGGSDANPNPQQPPAQVDTQPKAIKVGVLPDTQGGNELVAEHPMRALLDLYKAQGVKVVLVVGDLGENGTAAEHQQWRAVAEPYLADMTFLPIMGNHDNKGKDQDWHDWIGAVIPADAEHMAGARNKNYAVVRGNVLFLNISYGWMPFSYDFIERTIAKHRAKVDHILLQTHNSFVGNKYGLLRERIVEGYMSEEGDVAFKGVYDKYRRLFADNDVIYISGHEHMYARSALRDDTYRPFTQIVSGSASYKGYENRFGEHEQVQNTLMLKARVESTGSLDVNASIFDIQDDKIDFKAWYAEHTAMNNSGGAKELAAPNWRLFDRFTRSKTRCEKIVFPSSLPAGIQYNNTYDSSYRTSACASPNGGSARILDGENRTFNRHDTRTRTMAVEPGKTEANTNREMLSMMYRFMFTEHASWRPNLNNSQRARIVNEGTADEEIEVRATTIDLKKQVVLAWERKTAATLSDRLHVSGIAAQGGTYIDPYGVAKNIEVDTGLAGSRGDGSESGKAPVVLPTWASRGWTLDPVAPNDPYVLEFKLPAGATAANATLARWNAGTNAWVPVVASNCVSQQAYVAGYLTTAPSDVSGACVGDVVVGFDAARSAFWARLRQDGQFAIVAR